jgi:hypothetical protein
VDRSYYSQRIGRGPLANPTINDVARALTLAIDEMWKRDYMQEWHGFSCVDAGEVQGRAAMQLGQHIEAETGWRSAWPLMDPLIDPDEPHEDLELEAQQAEDMLFDLIEYFHRHVSEGIKEDGENFYHSFSNCGWHYNTFDPTPARALFLQRMNRTLVNYRDGFRISENGQLEHTANEGLDQLIDAALPSGSRGRSPYTVIEVAPRRTCVLL